MVVVATSASLMYSNNMAWVIIFCVQKAYRLSESLGTFIFHLIGRTYFFNFIHHQSQPSEHASFFAMSDTMEEITTTPRPPYNGFVPIKRARTESSESQLIRHNEGSIKYNRGKKIPLKNIRDKKLRGNLKALENKYKDATIKAKAAEILLENEGGFLEPETELERTFKVSQTDIRKNVSAQMAQWGKFKLKMDTGPYIAEYTRNGRDLLLAGRKGHVATMDWRDAKLGCELQLGETVRDVKWLYNNQRFAVAQKKYVYIYDGAGVEIHCQKKHIEVTNMEFLPYHYLLATVVSGHPISSKPVSNISRAIPATSSI